MIWVQLISQQKVKNLGTKNSKNCLTHSHLMPHNFTGKVESCLCVCRERHWRMTHCMAPSASMGNVSNCCKTMTHMQMLVEALLSWLPVWENLTCALHTLQLAPVLLAPELIQFHRFHTQICSECCSSEWLWRGLAGLASSVPTQNTASVLWIFFSCWKPHRRMMITNTKLYSAEGCCTHREIIVQSLVSC